MPLVSECSSSSSSIVIIWTAIIAQAVAETSARAISASVGTLIFQSPLFPFLFFMFCCLFGCHQVSLQLGSAFSTVAALLCTTTVTSKRVHYQFIYSSNTLLHCLTLECVLPVFNLFTRLQLLKKANLARLLNDVQSFLVCRNEKVHSHTKNFT